MSLELELLGLVAGALTTGCWLPQALKIIRSRDTQAISLTSQCLFTVGCTLWAVYGLIVGSGSILVFNAITALLGGAIASMKLKLG